MSTIEDDDGPDMTIGGTDSTRPSYQQFLAAVAAVGVCTIFGLGLHGWVADADIVMVYLLGVIFVAYRMERLPAIASALMSVAAFDFFFVTPYHTFAVHRLNFVLTFAIMTVVGVTISNLTARVKREAEQARRAQVKLETEKVRNAILSSVSHDLRTPLGSIMGAASTLAGSEDHLSPDTRRRFADTIYQESRRLDRLLENLLKMTRIEGQDLDVDTEWQIPSEIVGSALSHLERELDERAVSVDLPDGDRMANFDGPLVEQVLVNLLENAVEYSPPNSPIEVRGWFDDQRLHLEVADRGEGVAREERDEIFEKFQQGRLGSEHGSGLGLTISRAIIEAHGGEIEVLDRQEGRGAVFRCMLPQRETPPVDPPPIDDDVDSLQPASVS